MGIREIEEVLDSKMKQGGNTYLTAQTISEITGISIKNIMRDLRKMEARGMVKTYVQEIPLKHYRMNKDFYDDE